MKRILAVLLTCLLTFGGFSFAETDLQTVMIKELTLLIPNNVPYSNIFIDDHKITITFSNQTNITHFGSYIYYTMSVVSKCYEPSYSFSFVLLSNKDKPYMQFDTNIWEKGILYNFKSGEKVTKTINCLEDLMNEFPAMRTVGIGSSASNDDLEIYNEVMNILYEDFDRSEEEIFEELGPKYNMTGAELKEFMSETMKHIYE